MKTAQVPVWPLWANITGASHLKWHLASPPGQLDKVLFEDVFLRLCLAFLPTSIYVGSGVLAAGKYEAGCKTEIARFLVLVLQKLASRWRRLKSIAKFPGQKRGGDEGLTETVNEQRDVYCQHGQWWPLSEKNLTYNKYSLHTTKQ